jgi:hypothetical protein
LATHFQEHGVDLWNTKTPSGKTLKMGYDFIIPYLLGKQKWTGIQINEFKIIESIPLLFKASSVYGCDDCLVEMKRIAGSEYPSLLLNLL